MEQSAHMDNTAGRYSLSLIFGMDEFKLWFYAAGQMEQIVIPKGSLAGFSDHCVHGGARTNNSYDTYRLFGTAIDLDASPA